MTNDSPTTLTKVNASWYWPWNYFSSPTEIISKRNDWSTVRNDNLWWDITNTQEARQWPCATWYHIPTITAWKWLMSAWWWSVQNNDIILQTLKISGSVWTSTATDTSSYITRYIKPNIPSAYIISLGSKSYISGYPYNSTVRVVKAPIRCFKNYDVSCW
jgi:hypothetical protein